MSAREWVPGDVAVIRSSEPPYSAEDIARFMDEVIAWWPRRPKPNSGGVGMHGGSAMFKWFKDVFADAEFRPLVVIDPEDREQVERLVNLVDDAFNGVRIDGTGPTAVDLTQAALREFANPTPPKPEEPTGLGAVVEDADGARWVRDVEGHDADGPWYRRGVAKCRHYDDIAAVKVLSEGVTP